ncbi:MAG: dCTP diphosphatase [Chlamydiales bacterium]|jgi:dCTP diphosphatase
MNAKAGSIDVTSIQEFQRQFVKEREWDKYHTPKNVSMALVKEASELSEHFQWLTDDESFEIKNHETKFQEIKDEMGDVVAYLTRLADLLDIDLEQAFWDKSKKNEKKYPVNESKGTYLKWNTKL